MQLNLKAINHASISLQQNLEPFVMGQYPTSRHYFHAGSKFLKIA